MRQVARSLRRSVFSLMLGAAPLAPVALAASAVGCADLKEAFELSKDIKTETGIDNNVSINTSNGHTKITVTLGSKPEGDGTETEKKVIALAKKRFPNVDDVEVIR